MKKTVSTLIVLLAMGMAPAGIGQAQETMPLNSYWCAGERTDYFTTGTEGGQSAANDWSCEFKRTEGYVFPTQQPGTVPLELYWSDDRTDNAAVASEETKAELSASGYRMTASEGFIYATEEPGTVPLKLYFNEEMGEHYSTTSLTGEQAAMDEGFEFVRIEGYILPAIVEESPGTAEGPGGFGGCPPYDDPNMTFDARPIVNAIDTNQDGIMTLEEWTEAGAPEGSWNMFMEKDAHKKGYITRYEFLSETPPDGIDANCDGYITIWEFLATKKMAVPGGE